MCEHRHLPIGWWCVAELVSKNILFLVPPRKGTSISSLATYVSCITKPELNWKSSSRCRHLLVIINKFRKGKLGNYLNISMIIIIILWANLKELPSSSFLQSSYLQKQRWYLLFCNSATVLLYIFVVFVFRFWHPLWKTQTLILSLPLHQTTWAMFKHSPLMPTQKPLLKSYAQAIDTTSQTCLLKLVKHL